MTVGDISKFIVGYFNVDPARNEIALTMTSQWICKNIPAERHKELLQSVTENFIPTSTNAFPKIAEFKAALSGSAGNSERLANAAFDLILKKLNINKPAVVECPCAQAGLDAIGGWIALGNSEIEGLNWTRKNFVRAYCSAKADGVNSAPKIYSGISDNPSGTILIGDPERCAAAYLEYVSASKAPALADFSARGLVAGAISHLPAQEEVRA